MRANLLIIIICLSSTVNATMFAENIHVDGQGTLDTRTKTTTAEDRVLGNGIQDYVRSFSMNDNWDESRNDTFQSNYSLRNSSDFSNNKYSIAMQEPGLLHSDMVYGYSKDTKIYADGSISDSGGNVKTQYTVRRGTQANFVELLRDSKNSTHPIDLAETTISGKSNLFMNTNQHQGPIQLNGIGADRAWPSTGFYLSSGFITKSGESKPDWMQLNDTLPTSRANEGNLTMIYGKQPSPPELPTEITLNNTSIAIGEYVVGNTSVPLLLNNTSITLGNESFSIIYGKQPSPPELPTEITLNNTSITSGDTSAPVYDTSIPLTTPPTTRNQPSPKPLPVNKPSSMGNSAKFSIIWGSKLPTGPGPALVRDSYYLGQPLIGWKHAYLGWKDRFDNYFAYYKGDTWQDHNFTGPFAQYVPFN